MPRVIGIDIPEKKRLLISLTYLHGVGRKLSSDIIAKLSLDENMLANKLTQEQIAQLNAMLQSEYTVEGDLRREVQGNIKRLISISCYRGIRHRVGLPLRGQRTRTNSRTRKGKRRTIANKKKPA